MKIITSIKFTMAVGLALTALGCTKGGFSTNLSGSNTDSSSGNGGLSAPLNQQPVPQSIDISSSISTGTYSGLQSISIDRNAKAIILRVPLGPNIFITVSNGEVAQYPGVTYTTEVDANGTAYLTLRVPLKYVLHGVNGIDPLKLPNGDPLPMIPSGELPGLGLSIDTKNNVKLYVYIGVDAVGVYVETPMDVGIPFTFTVPVKNKDKTEVVGYFSMIPPKPNGAAQGGFFLSFQLPAQVSALLDKYVF